MANETPRASKGLIESLSVLATTLVGVAHTRLELLSVDLEEDRAHLLSLVFLYLVAIFCLLVGLILAIILIVFVLWQDHRLLALSLVAGFFLLFGLAIWFTAMHKTKTKPRLFSSSLSELFKDKEKLESR